MQLHGRGRGKNDTDAEHLCRFSAKKYWRFRLSREKENRQKRNLQVQRLLIPLNPYDGKALQSGTSHKFGGSFQRLSVFSIQKENKLHMYIRLTGV